MVHNLKKREIFGKAILSREQNRLYQTNSAGLDDVFRGSIDRFCDIAEKLRIAKSTLYAYLRHRGVKIGPYGRPRDTRRLKVAS